MYNGMQKMEYIIEEIEKNITCEIDYAHLAEETALSVYEFRRIFAFVVGCPLSEYVRKRRLSLAACELVRNKSITIGTISEKYGYSTTAAFSKAFSDFHGISPTVCQKTSPEIAIFPRPKFKWEIGEAKEQSFRIISEEAFSIKGYSAFSDLTDTCCCEKVWNDFYELGMDSGLSGDTLFVSYRNCRGTVKCCIGEALPATATAADDRVPESKWLCVKMNTTDDDAVNQKYNTIMCEILPSARLTRRSDLPTVEVFPRDMSSDDFAWEIRIPIE